MKPGEFYLSPISYLTLPVSVFIEFLLCTEDFSKHFVSNNNLILIRML